MTKLDNAHNEPLFTVSDESPRNRKWKNPVGKTPPVFLCLLAVGIFIGFATIGGRFPIHEVIS